MNTTFLAAGWLTVALFAERAPALALFPPNRPNILIIVADDLGWGDPSCFGNTRFQTPGIDRLAREGTRFTQFYQAAAVCTPARAAMLTGRWPAQLRMHAPLLEARSNAARDIALRLDPEVPTVADLLRDAGYATIHVGKWHLGTAEGIDLAQPSLLDYGFDASHWVDGKAHVEGRAVDLFAVQERPAGSATLVDATLAAIDQVKDKPFYCQLWLTDVHAPLAPSTEQRAPFRGQTPDGFTSPLEVYAASVTAMDRQIARLLEQLDARGIASNTLIIFTSDNGPADPVTPQSTWSAAGSPGPFRGLKRSLYEGGIRVPFIVRWPGTTPAGAVNDAAVISGVDLITTFCEVAGATVPSEVKGESALDAWRGATVAPLRAHPLMWEWRYPAHGHPWMRSPSLAIRDGAWKLLMNHDGTRVELYDIPRDPSELANVADRQPEVVARLSAALQAWSKSLPAGKIDPLAGDASYPWPKPMK